MLGIKTNGLIGVALGVKGREDEKEEGGMKGFESFM